MIIIIFGHIRKCFIVEVADTMFITESVGPFYFFPLVTTKFIHDPSNDHDNHDIHLERRFGCRGCQTHVQLAGSESSTRKARRHHYPGIGNMSLRNSIAVLNY